MTKRQQFLGMSLIEVLVSITVFSVAVAGMMLATQSVMDTTGTAHRRSIEAAYAKSLFADTPLYDSAVEVLADVTTKTEFSFPDGTKAWYTKEVDSCPITNNNICNTTHPDDYDSDIKNVNIYLWRNSTDTSPYRQFRFEARAIQNFRLADDTSPTDFFSIDSQGVRWMLNDQSASLAFSDTEDDRRAGWISSCPAVDYSTVTAITGTSDQAWFQSGIELNTPASCTFNFLASEDQKYILTIGMAEAAGGVSAGQRAMQVWVNGLQVGTFDAVDETGSLNAALTKSFEVTGTLNGNNVGVVSVQLLQDTGATLDPRVAFMSLKASAY